MLKPLAALLAAAALIGAGPDTAYPVKLIPGAFPDDRQPDGNTIVFEDADGLVVVDTGRHPDHQAAILDYARERGKPIVAIVNTHWHLDHSGGNRVIRSAFPQAKLYTSLAIVAALDGFLAKNLVRARERLADPKIPEAEKEDTRLFVAAMDDPKDLTPDVEVSGDTLLPFGKRGLRLHLAPYAATTGDTWIYDPASGTLVAGDLVVLPAPFFDTACAEGWREALVQIAHVPFKQLIPGHGPALTRAQFSTYRNAYGRLVDCAKGKAPKQACIDGWERDAAPLLTTPKDHKDVRELLDYYLDNILRKPGKQEDLCVGGGEVIG